VTVADKIAPGRFLLLALDAIALESDPVEPVDRVDRKPGADYAGAALHVRFAPKRHHDRTGDHGSYWKGIADAKQQPGCASALLLGLL
jgi:hypothetical protein